MRVNTLSASGIAKMLRNAAAAHHKAMGDAKDDWAAWYAAFLAPRLNRAVVRQRVPYRLTRRGAR